MYTMQLFLLILASHNFFIDTCNLEMSQQLFYFGLHSLEHFSVTVFFLHVYIQQNSAVFLNVLIDLFCINSFIV